MEIDYFMELWPHGQICIAGIQDNVFRRYQKHSEGKNMPGIETKLINAVYCSYLKNLNHLGPLAKICFLNL